METKVVEVVELLDANKAKFAFLGGVGAAILSAVGSWIVSGDFNDSEIRTAVSCLFAGGASSLLAFRADAGRAKVKS